MKPFEQELEAQRLNQIAGDSWYLSGIAPRTIEYSGKIFSRYLRGGHVLELGPAEGTMTELLRQHADRLTLVEGAETFCDILRTKYPDATVICSLFEDYRPAERFDTIVLGHVLEHVDDPVEILRLVRDWVRRGGTVLAAVPNARSLHRQAAVMMGLLPSQDALNDTDIHHGHRRVYTPELLRAHFLQAGYQIDVFGGYWLKPLSNKQIESSWTPEMLAAFMQLGEYYPDIAAEIYVVASRH